jgi:tripartite-type tricarboxylate transporter receptor subunit TctC
MKVRHASSLVTLITVLHALPVSAQDYPAKPVRLIVNTAAGGLMDVAARVTADHLGKALGQRFIIENRPGAGTTLAAMQAVRSTPDGYTLMQATSTTMAINVSMQKKMPYEPLKDLVPVALLSSSPFFLVVKSDSPVKTVADLIALAKSKPNGLNYGSGGPGSMHHLSTELLQSLAGIEMTHVPYKATPPAMNDLLAGHIQVLFGDTTSVLPMIQQGTVRGIAVTTAKRSPAAPDIPAVAETLPGYESASWQMLVAPGATPPEVVALLNREVHTIFSNPAVIAELERRGIGPALTGTPDEVRDFVKKEIVRWGDVVRRAGLEGSQ